MAPQRRGEEGELLVVLVPPWNLPEIGAALNGLGAGAVVRHRGLHEAAGLARETAAELDRGLGLEERAGALGVGAARRAARGARLRRRGLQQIVRRRVQARSEKFGGACLRRRRDGVSQRLHAHRIGPGHQLISRMSGVRSRVDPL